MSQRRALVVDDDRSILEVLAMRLESMGLSVEASSSPAEVPKILAEQVFDLALFDLRMVPLDGLALLQLARDRQPHLPVLIMTAHGSINGAVDAIRRGAFDYLTKPFVREELQGKVTRALAERRWAHDRELLSRVGTSLASGDTTEGVLQMVVHATLDATDTQWACVYLEEDRSLVLRACAGTAIGSDAELLRAATKAMSTTEASVVKESAEHVVIAAPLLAERTVRGVLVAETMGAFVPTKEDLSVLGLFASHAAIALRTSHELERARSGALAALGRVAAQVAHEINNPLGGLKVYAQLVGRRLASLQDQHGVDLVQKIDGAIDRLAALVSDITAYGRPPELKREPTDPDEIVAECLALVQDRIEERNIRVVYDRADGLGLMSLDAREMRKAVMNSIVNALDAMTDRGTLTVRTLRGADGGLAIAVADTGDGMDEATRARAFDLFFTTKNGGTGLGMGIIRSAIERHGGRITIDSTPGQGTTLTMTVPDANA